MNRFQEIAAANYQRLSENEYPGRLLVVGPDDTERYLVQGYAIMGRSSKSKNRIFVSDGEDEVRTALADESQGGDTSLIIYKAMAKTAAGLYVVSNGDQTDHILRDISYGVGHNMFTSMHMCTYEPDEPNFTPRITAVCSVEDGVPTATLSILRKSPFANDCGPGMCCDRDFFSVTKFQPGIGHCLHTYEGDGDPLPAFRGQPFWLPLIGSIDSVADKLWYMLDEDNRVSLVVKFIEIATGKSEVRIINRYQKVSAE